MAPKLNIKTGTGFDDFIDLSTERVDWKVNLGNGNDVLLAGSGNDTVNAGDGNDKVTGGAGNDSINGNDGFDTAVYAHSVFDYLNENGMLNITPLLGNAISFATPMEGTDTLKNIEALEFSDATYYMDGRNNAPVARDGEATTDEETVAEIDISQDIFDFDGDALSIVAATSASGIAVTWDNATYTLSYDPAGNYDYLGVNDKAYDTITYEISDGNGGTTTAIVNLMITGVNDAPTNTGNVVLDAIDEDTSTTIYAADLLANASDKDASDVLSVENLTASSGTLVDNGDGSWTFTPAKDDDTEVSFSYDITDGHGGSVSGSATMDLLPVDDIAPFSATLSQSIPGPSWGYAESMTFTFLDVPAAAGAAGAYFDVIADITSYTNEEYLAWDIEGIVSGSFDYATADTAVETYDAYEAHLTKNIAISAADMALITADGQIDVSIYFGPYVNIYDGTGMDTADDQVTLTISYDAFIA